ncbi:hypothetical protein SAMN05421676_108134 [Salinibacillus kushneri]|uniref:Uncharacterized protein n=1 Tax=Salinibacillus kushneri TaxID=237682 RepID=A0A1I0HAH9_9BACI|nr:hypothetical protein SAMN05421676_108134 [Salinibacillus kushneri]
MVINNLFRGLSMAHIKGYHQLKDWQKDMFNVRYYIQKALNEHGRRF